MNVKVGWSNIIRSSEGVINTVTHDSLPGNVWTTICAITLERETIEEGDTLLISWQVKASQENGYDQVGFRIHGSNDFKLGLVENTYSPMIAHGTMNGDGDVIFSGSLFLIIFGIDESDTTVKLQVYSKGNASVIAGQNVLSVDQLYE